MRRVLITRDNLRLFQNFHCIQRASIWLELFSHKEHLAIATTTEQL